MTHLQVFIIFLCDTETKDSFNTCFLLSFDDWKEFRSHSFCNPEKRFYYTSFGIIIVHSYTRKNVLSNALIELNFQDYSSDEPYMRLQHRKGYFSIFHEKKTASKTKALPTRYKQKRNVCLGVLVNLTSSPCKVFPSNGPHVVRRQIEWSVHISIAVHACMVSGGNIEISIRNALISLVFASPNTSKNDL